MEKGAKTARAAPTRLAAQIFEPARDMASGPQRIDSKTLDHGSSMSSILVQVIVGGCCLALVYALFVGTSPWIVAVLMHEHSQLSPMANSVMNTHNVREAFDVWTTIRAVEALASARESPGCWCSRQSAYRLFRV